MIASVLALALAASAQVESEAFQLGRSSFYGGLCSTLGWEGDRENAIARGQAWARARPDLQASHIVAEMNRGMEIGREDVLALMDAFQASGDAARFGQELTARCDQVVRDEPELLSRTSQTDQLLEDRIASLRREPEGD